MNTEKPKPADFIHVLPDPLTPNESIVLFATLKMPPNAAQAFSRWNHLMYYKPNGWKSETESLALMFNNEMGFSPQELLKVKEKKEQALVGK